MSVDAHALLPDSAIERAILFAVRAGAFERGAREWPDIAETFVAAAQTNREKVAHQLALAMRRHAFDCRRGEP